MVYARAKKSASKSKTPPTTIHRILLLFPKDMADTSTTPTVLVLIRNGKYRVICVVILSLQKLKRCHRGMEDEDLAEGLRGDVFEVLAALPVTGIRVSWGSL
jgi:hypothetical protein